MPEVKPTFEEALAELERSAADIARPDITLEEALANFEKGVENYNICSAILNSAKQKITTYSKEQSDEEC